MDNVAKKTIDERFKEQLIQHPEIYREFRRLATQLLYVGKRHWGAQAILEVLRYQRAMSGKPEDIWKINNDFASRMARKLMTEDKRFADFFEIRQLRTP